MHFFPPIGLLGEIASGRGEALLVWSVRVAVVFYLLRMFIAVRAGLVSRVPTKLECVFWAIGCGAYLIHVFCAFEFRTSGATRRPGSIRPTRPQG